MGDNIASINQFLSRLIVPTTEDQLRKKAFSLRSSSVINVENVGLGCIFLTFIWSAS